ncbi:hypothetical protein CJ480_14770 [Bacillus subtilis]|uniref:hypothetical protein n=1 Tax=Bacillus subtilis TaxID=1423 RepID=UPI000E7586CD|nr:hypothetical protein [Bacillus subtilis]RJS52992.1 hypothetical protein CJ480_14770 [Bacillus subtilis]
MKKKFIAGALALGLIPFMGVTDISAKTLKDQSHTLKPAWACEGTFLECGPFSEEKGDITFNYEGGTKNKIRVFVANDGNKPFDFSIYYPNGKVLQSDEELKPGKTFIKEYTVKQQGTYIFNYDSGTGESVDGFFKVVKL